MTERSHIRTKKGKKEIKESLKVQRYRNVGRDSSVGIATRYGLGGPGIVFRWGRDFPHPSRPALGPTHPPIKGCRVFPGVKRPGPVVDYPSPSSAEVKARVELYLYSPPGTSWPILG